MAEYLDPWAMSTGLMKARPVSMTGPISGDIGGSLGTVTGSPVSTTGPMSDSFGNVTGLPVSTTGPISGQNSIDKLYAMFGGQDAFNSRLFKNAKGSLDPESPFIFEASDLQKELSPQTGFYNWRLPLTGPLGYKENYTFAVNPDQRSIDEQNSLITSNESFWKANPAPRMYSGESTPLPIYFDPNELAWALENMTPEQRRIYDQEKNAVYEANKNAALPSSFTHGIKTGGRHGKTWNYQLIDGYYVPVEDLGISGGKGSQFDTNQGNRWTNQALLAAAMMSVGGGLGAANGGAASGFSSVEAGMGGASAAGGAGGAAAGSAGGSAAASGAGATSAGTPIYMAGPEAIQMSSLPAFTAGAGGVMGPAAATAGGSGLLSSIGSKMGEMGMSDWLKLGTTLAGGLAGASGAGPQTTTTSQSLPPELQQLLANLVPRVQQTSPVLNAANQQALDTIQGKYLGSNPYLEDMVRQQQDQMQNRFGTTMMGSGAFGNANVAQQGFKAMNEAANNLRFQNYEQERQRQMQAASQAPNLNLAPFAPAFSLLGLGGRNTTQTAPGLSTGAGLLGGALAGAELYNTWFGKK